MIKKNKIKKESKYNLIIFGLLITALLFMSVGFASYNKTINLSGTAIIKPDGKIYIKSVTLTSSNHATANPGIDSNGNINFNLSFTTVNDSQAVYTAVFTVVVANESSYDYIYNIPDYHPTIHKGQDDYSENLDYDINGITFGNVVPSDTEKTFTITFTFQNPDLQDTGTYEVNGNFMPDFHEDTSGRIIAHVDTTTTGDLRGSNNLAQFSVEVINTYSINKSFTIVADSEKFVTRNMQDTGTPEYTINANDAGTTFNFKLAKVANAEYYEGTQKVKILVVPTGDTGVNAGKVTVLVDVTALNQDNDPPEISNVVITRDNIEGQATLTWNGTDDSTITDYKIIVYKDGVQLGNTIDTQSDDEEYVFSNLATGDYSFLVYGVDSNGNEADANDISNASTSAGPACKSAVTNLKWRYNVTTNNMASYLNFSGNNYAIIGQQYTATVSPKDTNAYQYPTKNQVVITMNGQSYTGFTYSQSNGSIVISSVTGDINIEATANEVQGTCLVEGTKILLADGSYKNIEDIEYTDLLRVYNHVNGKLTNVYPIWIEQGSTADSYKKLTFNDGGTLKVVNSHSIFDVDKKCYIDIANENECKIGTRIYKIKDGKLDIVSITNIETINEEVGYYNIVSTMYYNIIANDILTTDPTSSISNIYGFKENAVYGDNYYHISNGEGLEYKNIRFIPYYLYKGLNLKNAGLLIGNKLDTEFLRLFVLKNTKQLPLKDGQLLFKVTTSFDSINSEDINSNMYKEGSVYQLPINKAKKYINTATNEVFDAGDKVNVEYSMHFEAID